MTIQKLLALLFLPLLTLCLCSLRPYAPAYEVKAHKALNKLGYQLADQYGLCFLNFGNGSHLVGSRDCDWAFHFMGRQKLTLEEVRPIAHAISQKLIDNIYSDPVYTHYQKKWAEGTTQPPKKISPALVGFRLSFWDENMDRPLKPYIAQIRMVNGKLYYYYSDSSQWLLEPIIEDLNLADTPHG